MGNPSYRIVMGEKLKDFREMRGITLQQVAEAAGISLTDAALIEAGANNYTIDTFLAYISAADLYIYFAPKTPTDIHDFSEMANQSSNYKPRKK